MSPEENLTGCDIPTGFAMPTMAEIEEILALGDRSWKSVAANGNESPQPDGRAASRRRERTRRSR